MRGQTVSSRPACDNGVGLDLDEHRGVDQGLNLDHCGGGRVAGEELAMRTPETRSESDVRHKHPGTHDIGHSSGQPLQRLLDDLQATPCLCVGIPRSEHAAVVSQGGCR